MWYSERKAGGEGSQSNEVAKMCGTMSPKEGNVRFEHQTFPFAQNRIAYGYVEHF